MPKLPSALKFSQIIARHFETMMSHFSFWHARCLLHFVVHWSVCHVNINQASNSSCGGKSSWDQESIPVGHVSSACWPEEGVPSWHPLHRTSLSWTPFKEPPFTEPPLYRTPFIAPHFTANLPSQNPPPPHVHTNTSENITFPQLRLRVVKMFIFSYSKEPSLIFKGTLIREQKQVLCSMTYCIKHLNVLRDVH